MRYKERQRRESGWLAGISCGFMLLALSSCGLAGEPTDSVESRLEQALATVQHGMAASPAPWPDGWQQEYLATIREALTNDPNLPDYSARLEVFRRGFLRYWAQAPGSGLTQAEYDLRKAEMRWYCSTLMAEEPASASEKAVLKGQLRDLCDYAAEYLKGRFPFLTPVCVEEAEKAALAEFDQEVESPLLPIFRRPFSEDQLRAIKASWAHLYRRWHFTWREVRYRGGEQGDLSDPGDLTTHPHYRFAKRCLTYLPRTFWTKGVRPPAYVVDATRRLNAERVERGRINRQGANTERELAMRTSNQVEQVEEWSFVFTALLETANSGSGQEAPGANSAKGGDAYGLKKQP